MKRFLKLVRDVRPQEQPPESYQFAKNGIQSWLKGSSINEPGFALSSAVPPYRINGVIETDKWPVIFSTDNTNSAFGYYNTDQDTYVPIFDDADLGFKVGFNTNHWITGVVQRNYKGELVGAFTDKVLKPFYVNFDNPNISVLSDMLLFPNALSPKISVSTLAGGLLLPGAYYAAIKYVKQDGTETAFLAISSPQIVTGTTGQATGQAIQIQLDNLDPNYEEVQVAIITKVNGVISCVQFLEPLPVSGNATILYTGNELTEAITLEEILIAPAIYDTVGTMGQLNDAMYIGNLVSEPAMKMQPFANMVKLQWKSELITVDPVDPTMKTGTEKTFLHDETYGFYIRYSKTVGGFTPAYHIPGPAPISGDTDTSTIASGEGITAKKFQVEDKISVFDPISMIGNCGPWLNGNENYPNTDDYNSSLYGGEDLRGQPVRHHKFPSIKWCRTNLYPGEPDYGRGSLDKLGIIAQNIIIPQAYADQINGYEILYAKRNTGNSTVLGQSLLLFGSKAKLEPEYVATSYFTTGGNFDSYINFRTTDHKDLLLDQSIFRFHAFDILFNQPALSPTHLSLELKLNRAQLTDDTHHQGNDFISDSGSMNKPLTYLFDYLKKGTPTKIPSTWFKAVDSTQYVPNNSLVGKWQNRGGETCFGGKITNPEHLLSDTEIDTSIVWDADNRRKGVNFETTFLANLKAVLTDLFVPFVGQSLARAGSSQDVNAHPTMWGGDTYICDYTFHTYGWWVSDQPQNEGEFSKGTHTVRRILCECAANLYGRTETPGNLYSSYYPKSTLSAGDANNYDITWTRSKDPNQFGYSKDSNALDDLISTAIFDTHASQLTSHPYRIHRSGKLSKQTKNRSWRTFLPLDYYEMQKNMGGITKLEGMDDRLLIHMQNALFLTQDKAQLNSDVLSITLGAGDIFQFEPQEGMSSKLGYAGNQHELATIRTPYGYVFIDNNLKQVFKFKGQLELITNAMVTFFNRYLRVQDKNVFQGNGYTLGYDPTYKRLLLTIKNKSLANTSIPVFDFDPTLFPTLAVNSYISYNGRLVKFLGVNDSGSTGFSCPALLTPSANNLEVTIPETTAIGTLIGTVTGTYVENFFLVTGTYPFTLGTDGKLYVTGPLDYYIQHLYVMTGTAISKDGLTASFTVTVHVTFVNRPPKVLHGEITIPDDTAVNTDIFTVLASDREGDTLTYSITGGNTNSTFAINSSTGHIKVADTTDLNGLLYPKYILTISVSDGTHTTTGTVIVYVTHVNRAPVPVSDTITILDTTPDGALVYQMDTTGWDEENDPLTLTFIRQSVGGVFNFNPSTGQVTLNTNAALNVETTPSYTLYFSVKDAFHAPVNFTLTINVIYDRSSISFSPESPTCSGGSPTCPSGYTLSADGTACTKVTTVGADSSGGSGVALQHYGYSQYGEWGTIIYPYGSYGTDGAPTTKPNTSLILSGSPLWGYKPSGEMTYSGNLWGNPSLGTAQDGTCGRLNQTGVWKQGDQYYTSAPLGFSRQFNISATGRYYIAVGVDDFATISINGTAIITQNPTNINSAFNSLYGAGVATTADLFRYWHVYEVQLSAGVNVISITGTNSSSIGVVGCEIYSATLAQLKACTTTSGLAPYIVFSSAAPSFGSITNGDMSDVGLYNCSSHAGYVLVYDPGTSSYYCKLVQTAAPSTPTNVCTWGQVRIFDTRKSTTIELVANASTSPVAMFQDIPIPYYPPVSNSDQCGGTVHLYTSYGNSISAQKNNCDIGYTGSVVVYRIPPGQYSSTASQDAADAQATADVLANGQTYANSKGICT